MLVKHLNKFSGKVLKKHVINDCVTLFDVVKHEFSDYDGALGYPLTVCLNGELIIQRRWPNVKVAESDVIELITEPQAAAVPFIIKAVISYAVNYVVTYLTTPKPDNYNTTAEGSSIHQASGRANTPRLGSPPAQLFGKHRYWPDLISAPWRQYEGNTQYLYLMLSTGIGVYDYEEIKIGNTSIEGLTGFSHNIVEPGGDVTAHEAHRNIYTSPEVGGTSSGSGLLLDSGGFASASNAMPDGLEYDFSGNTITAIEQVDDGLGGFVATPYNWPYTVDQLIEVASSFNNDVYKVSAVDANVLTVNDSAGASINFTGTSSVSAIIDQVTAVTEGEWLGPFQACPSGSVTDTIFLDFLYPNGLGQENEDGGIDRWDVWVDVEWREVGTESWSRVHADEHANTRDQIGSTLAISIGSSYTAEVQLRRANKDSDSATVRDTVYWQSLKSELPAKTSYDKVSTMAVRIRGDETLAASAENQINTIQCRHLETWDGTQWLPAAPTRDIAPVVAYLLKNSGHPESVIRFDELAALDTKWQSRGQQFNGVFDTATTLSEALSRVLQCGFAKHYLAKGQVYVTVDEPKDAFSLKFTPDNTTKITESGTLGGYNSFDGVKIEYTDNETWLPAFIECVLPQNDGDNLQAVRLYGCTDIDLAYRFGMRKASEMEYLKRNWSVETELEGLNVGLSDKCTVPNRQTQSGLCEAYDSRALSLANEVTMVDGEDYYIGVRKLDGTISGPYSCTLIDSQTVLLADDLDFVPTFDDATDPPFYSLGTASEWATPVVAQKIVPSNTNKTSLTFVAYDERIFDYDEAVAPDD